MQERCYISIATIKRAESNHPISNTTLKKFAIFFNVSIESLIVQESLPHNEISLNPLLKNTTLDWPLVPTLATVNEHQKLSILCEELYALLQLHIKDNHLNDIFSHHI